MLYFLISNPKYANFIFQRAAMKKNITVLLLFFSVIGANAQLNVYGGIEDSYRNFMLQSHTQFTKTVLNDFLGVGGDQRFMSNNWVSGGATNNFNVTISSGYLFNYDFLGQELHAKWKDTTIIVNTNYVTRFFLVNNNRTHNFVKSPVIDPQGNFFFESLAFDEQSTDSGKVQLLKLRTIKQIKANKNDYLANFSGDYDDKLDNKIDYYLVSPDNNFVKIRLNKKSLISALEKQKEKVDNYFKRTSGFDEEIAAGLIRYINE